MRPPARPGCPGGEGPWLAVGSPLPSPPRRAAPQPRHLPGPGPPGGLSPTRPTAARPRPPRCGRAAGAPRAEGIKATGNDLFPPPPPARHPLPSRGRMSPGDRGLTGVRVAVGREARGRLGLTSRGGRYGGRVAPGPKEPQGRRSPGVGGPQEAAESSQALTPGLVVLCRARESLVQRCSLQLRSLETTVVVVSPFLCQWTFSFAGLF